VPETQRYLLASLEQEAARVAEVHRVPVLACVDWAVQTLERLVELRVEGRCSVLIAFRSAECALATTPLIELDLLGPAIRGSLFTKIDDLRAAQPWKLLCIAQWLADVRLGVVPTDVGELRATEGDPRELHRIRIDFYSLMGLYHSHFSLLRGMHFASFLVDGDRRLLATSLRNPELWTFGAPVCIGMDVAQLGPVVHVDAVPWDKPLLNEAALRDACCRPAVVRHEKCPCADGAVAALDWLQSNDGANDEGVKLEWQCSKGHTNVVDAPHLRRASTRSFFSATCPRCIDLRDSDQRPADQGICRLSRIFVAPAAPHVS
jgi:hypothetical protein